MKKSGFTMIELIFVIVILGVLAAVAIPKLNATRDDAEQAKAMTNLATLMGDLTSYYTAQGSFADKISAMTNVPLSVDKNDQTKADFKIKNDTCLQFEVNDATGDLTITSVAESAANPVCKHLIANTSTQNILSGTYECKGKYTSAQVPASNPATFQWGNYAAVSEATTELATECEKPAYKPTTTPTAESIDYHPAVPAKMDTFGKTITMNFQGAGVKF